jgi:hypothetical protein
MGFSILQAPSDESFCAITQTPPEFVNFARPARGKSMAGSYPATLDLAMSKLVHPAGLQVGDAVLNGLRYVIVSERLKEVLEARASGPIEFLPFRLINHKGRPMPGLVYIVNVIGCLDCADPARSQGEVSPFKRDNGAFMDCTRLALDERKVPPEATIFRTSLFTPAIFVRDDVRAAIEAKGMTVRFVTPGDPL